VRRDIHLKSRYAEIISYTGLILTLSGFLLLTPLLVLAAWPEESEHWPGFLLPAILLSGTGVAVWRTFRRQASINLSVQEGGVVVLLTWITVILFSAWPLMAVQKLDFTQAVFESMSGWTTTGLSVVDVTKSTHLILLWRSIMQLAGGAGLAIIMLTAIAGPVGPGLTLAEGRSDQLAPHVRESAKLVLKIYSGYALMGTFAYWMVGMSFFDAVNHTFAAISTGGFSTRVESIGYWDSPTIELITMTLMFFGNMNFLTAYLILQGKLKAVSRNGELRVMATVTPLFALAVFFLVCRSIYPSLGKSVRVAIFETFSALTTTGFSTVSYSNWNSVGILALVVLMLIGGGTCSTAGGIKQYRVYILFKSLLWELRSSFFPSTAVVKNYVWQGEWKDYIKDSHIRHVANFVFLYLVTYFVGSGILAAHGYGIGESLFEFASSVGTVGLSVGVTTPDAPAGVLWAETIGMFLGRLEFMVIFVSTAKIIRDSYAMMLR